MNHMDCLRREWDTSTCSDVDSLTALESSRYIFLAFLELNLGTVQLLRTFRNHDFVFFDNQFARPKVLNLTGQRPVRLRDFQNTEKTLCF